MKLFSEIMPYILSLLIVLHSGLAMSEEIIKTSPIPTPIVKEIKKEDANNKCNHTKDDKIENSKQTDPCITAPQDEPSALPLTAKEKNINKNYENSLNDSHSVISSRIKNACIICDFSGFSHLD